MIAALGAAAVVANGRAHAAPLQKEACAVLTEEQVKLDAEGVKELLKAGPAGVGRDSIKLEKVRRYLEVEEDLLFRCGEYKVRTTLPRDIEDGPPPEPPPAANTPAPDQKAEEKPVEAPKPQAKAKAKASSQPKPHASAEAKADDSAGWEPVKTKPAPKTKKPPAGEASKAPAAAKKE